MLELASLRRLTPLPCDGLLGLGRFGIVVNTLFENGVPFELFGFPSRVMKLELALRSSAFGVEGGSTSVSGGVIAISTSSPAECESLSSSSSLSCPRSFRTARYPAWTSAMYSTFFVKMVRTSSAKYLGRTLVITPCVACRDSTNRRRETDGINLKSLYKFDRVNRKTHCLVSSSSRNEQSLQDSVRAFHSSSSRNPR